MVTKREKNCLKSHPKIVKISTKRVNILNDYDQQTVRITKVNMSILPFFF